MSKRLVRDVCLLVAAMIVAATGGLLANQRLSSTVEQRVAEGIRADATVVGVTRYHLVTERAVRATVAYEVAGRRYDASLMWGSRSDAVRALEKGDAIQVYLDPADPERIATADHGGSEGWLLLVPVRVAGVAVAVLLVAIVIRVTGYRRGR